MTLWLERLRPSDLQVMLPQVLLTLGQIRDQAMEPERRLAMLRSLKDQVESIQASIPVTKPQPEPAGPSNRGLVHSLTLEQRLGRSWCGNLQRLLMDFGQPRYQGNTRFAVYREWTLRQLLKGYSQAIEPAVRQEQDPAAGTWRGLHELFLYLEGRDELVAGQAVSSSRFNPGADYKRLLLLGGIGGCDHGSRILAEVGGKLREWAGEADLRQGDCGVGDGRLLRVDVTGDEPPHWNSQGIDKPYRGWLLEPPRAYTDFLEPYRQRKSNRLERV